jgi:hypothetical protein
MKQIIAGLALTILATSVAAEESAEYKRGYCDAVAAVVRNRDHYRALVHYPAETVEDSMTRIYEKWPPRPPAGFEVTSIVADQLNLEMAGIDLYVILPPQLCQGVR